MIHSLKIGMLIYSNIINSDIADSVGTKVYPIVAPAETTYPFIVYTRANAYPNTDTKDGWLEDHAAFQITVVSDKYIESAEIADDVRDAFENCIISNDELTLNNIRLSSCSEAASEDAYTQTLYFECDCE